MRRVWILSYLFYKKIPDTLVFYERLIKVAIFMTNFKLYVQLFWDGGSSSNLLKKNPFKPYKILSYPSIQNRGKII